MNKYQIIKVIGDGTYGKVYEGINIETNEKVAIKKLKNKIQSWEECVNQNEVYFLRKLNHENIIKLMEVIREQNSDVSYIFEYCDCNLFEFIEKHRKQKTFIPEAKIRNIIYQITSGMKYLHSQKIMHRDLKPENILMILNTNMIKIADFGTAKEVPEFKNNNLTDYVCTRWYRAPECALKSINYDEKIDVWAIGCIMAELYTLKPLFPGMDELDQFNKIVKILGTPEYENWPEGYTLIQKMNIRFPNYTKVDLKNKIFSANDDAINFLELIFQYDSKKRPSCSELLKHPYFTEVQRPGSYSYQGRNNMGNNNKNFLELNPTFNKNFLGTANLRMNSYQNDMSSPSNKNIGYNTGNIADRILSEIKSNNPFSNNIGLNSNNKVEGYFNKIQIPYERNNKNSYNQVNNLFRVSSKINENNNYDNNNDERHSMQNEISKNNYNYYKNFNFSNYLNHNGAVPDIDSMFQKNLLNLQRGGEENSGSAFSKYNNNNLMNSFNQQEYNGKFSSFAKNDIMKNIGRERQFSLQKSHYDDNSNNTLFNYGNNNGGDSPCFRKRERKIYDSAIKNISNNNFSTMYNY